MGEPPWGWLCPRGTPQLTHSHQAPQQLIPWDMVLRRHPQTSPIRGVHGTKGSSLRCHIGPELTQQVHIIPRVHPLGHGQHRHPKSTSRGWMSTPGPCTGTPRPHPSGAWATLAPQELTQRVSGAAWAPTPPLQPCPGRGSPRCHQPSTYLVAQQSLPVSHLHQLHAPALLQQRVLHHHRGGPQPEGGEQVGVDVIPGAAQVPAEAGLRQGGLSGEGAGAGPCPTCRR